MMGLTAASILALLAVLLQRLLAVAMLAK